MVTCISQLILLAHAGRIGRLPSLDTIEYAMKGSPLIVQALWDKASPLLQLPHIVDDMLKHFHSRKRNIKTLQQLAKMKVNFSSPYRYIVPSNFGPVTVSRIVYH